MIIKELKKKNNNTYIVKTDSGDYVFSEDVGKNKQRFFVLF